MSNRFESFPMINDDCITQLNVNLKLLEAKYNFDNNLSFMKDEEKDNIYILDNNGIWSNYTNDLCIIGELEITNFNILFNEYKVVEKDTVLGIGMTYISKGSSKTYSKSIGEANANDNTKKVIDFKLDFKPGELASILKLNFFIYVKKAQMINNNIFAHNSGTILGNIYNCELIIEGNGSDFPIVIIDSPDTPLWDMYVDFEGLDDVFSRDSICLRINRSHQQFSKLGIDKISLNNNLIWKEILASFFVNIFIASQQIENLDSLFYEDVQEGTVGGFLKFLIITFKILPNELKNPISLSLKIRKGLDNLL